MVVDYQDGGKTALVDGIRFTRDERTGYYLATRNTSGNRRERLHEYVYRTRVGDIPDGLQIHHVDGNKSDNEPGNLKALTPREHQRWHSEHMSEERRQKLRENLVSSAVPKAAEWHRSEEGREWHRKHGREVAANARPKTFTCDFCGKTYATKKQRDSGHHFCSGKCKSAWRRRSGVDNETRVCAHCGREFTANKYGKARFCCKSCAGAARRARAGVQHDC